MKYQIFYYIINIIMKLVPNAIGKASRCPCKHHKPIDQSGTIFERGCVSSIYLTTS